MACPGPGGLAQSMQALPCRRPVQRAQDLRQVECGRVICEEPAYNLVACQHNMHIRGYWPMATHPHPSLVQADKGMPSHVATSYAALTASWQCQKDASVLRVATCRCCH